MGAPNAGRVELNAVAVAENWQLSTRRVVHLARSQVCSSCLRVVVQVYSALRVLYPEIIARCSSSTAVRSGDARAK